MVDLCSGDSVSHAVNRNTVSVIKIKICVRIQIKRIPCFLTETLDKVRANDICTFISMFFIKTVESLRKKKHTTIQKCKASVSVGFLKNCFLLSHVIVLGVHCGISKILTVYHSLIHPSIILLYSSFPNSWISFSKSCFSIYIHEYVILF
jgi:hypothetical protein